MPWWFISRWISFACFSYFMRLACRYYAAFHSCQLLLPAFADSDIFHYWYHLISFIASLPSFISFHFHYWYAILHLYFHIDFHYADCFIYAIITFTHYYYITFILSLIFRFIFIFSFAFAILHWWLIHIAITSFIFFRCFLYAIFSDIAIDFATLMIFADISFIFIYYIDQYHWSFSAFAFFIFLPRQLPPCRRQAALHYRLITAAIAGFSLACHVFFADYFASFRRILLPYYAIRWSMSSFIDFLFSLSYLIYFFFTPYLMLFSLHFSFHHWLSLITFFHWLHCLMPLRRHIIIDFIFIDYCYCHFHYAIDDFITIHTTFRFRHARCAADITAYVTFSPALYCMKDIFALLLSPPFCQPLHCHYAVICVVLRRRTRFQFSLADISRHSLTLITDISVITLLLLLSLLYFIFLLIIIGFTPFHFLHISLLLISFSFFIIEATFFYATY